MSQTLDDDLRALDALLEWRNHHARLHGDDCAEDAGVVTDSESSEELETHWDASFHCASCRATFDISVSHEAVSLWLKRRQIEARQAWEELGRWRSVHAKLHDARRGVMEIEEEYVIDYRIGMVARCRFCGDTKRISVDCEYLDRLIDEHDARKLAVH